MYFIVSAFNAKCSAQQNALHTAALIQSAASYVGKVGSAFTGVDLVTGAYNGVREVSLRIQLADTKPSADIYESAALLAQGLSQECVALVYEGVIELIDKNGAVTHRGDVETTTMEQGVPVGITSWTGTTGFPSRNIFSRNLRAV